MTPPNDPDDENPPQLKDVNLVDEDTGFEQVQTDVSNFVDMDDYLKYD